MLLRQPLDSAKNVSLLLFLFRGQRHDLQAIPAVSYLCNKHTSISYLGREQRRSPPCWWHTRVQLGWRSTEAQEFAALFSQQPVTQCDVLPWGACIQFVPMLPDLRECEPCWSTGDQIVCVWLFVLHSFWLHLQNQILVRNYCQGNGINYAKEVERHLHHCMKRNCISFEQYEKAKEQETIEKPAEKWNDTLPFLNKK